MREKFKRAARFLKPSAWIDQGGLHRFFDRLNTTVHSIRFRLSLWFVLVLAVIMLAFSAFVYYRQYVHTSQQTLSRINLRLRDLDTSFRRSFYEDQTGGWLKVPGTSPGSTVTLQPYEVVVLADPYGKIASYWGLINEADASELARLSPNREGGKMYSVTLIPKTANTDGSAVEKTLSSGQRQEYLFITAPVGYDNRLLGWVVVGQPVDPDGYLPRLLLTLSMAGGFTLVSALAGGYWLADRALRPVQAITRTARQINDNDLSRRLNIHSRDELGELAGTFDSMLDRLQAAFIRQRRFTADASHELRTPLTIIGLEADRALEPGRSTADIRRSLQVIQSENEFMTHLVTELLTLARMEAGQIELQKQPLDLSDLALEVAERYASLARHKHIRLETGDLPELTILGDRKYLGLVVGNLVDNAIKYSPRGKGQWVRVETGALNGSAWVRVSDNGPGISAEHLPHLFERFYRADTARSHNPAEGEGENPAEIPGSGLGLSIAQWIVNLHNGKISVQSEVNQGSTFEVTLPLA